MDMEKLHKPAFLKENERWTITSAAAEISVIEARVLGGLGNNEAEKHQFSDLRRRLTDPQDPITAQEAVEAALAIENGKILR